MLQKNIELYGHGLQFMAMSYSNRIYLSKTSSMIPITRVKHTVRFKIFKFWPVLCYVRIFTLAFAIEHF